MKKRAIAEIIAYVLLIALSLASSGVVYSWLKNTAPSEDKFIDCPNVYASIKDTPCMCIAEGLNLVFKNRGLFAFDGFVLRFSDVDEYGVKNYVLNKDGFSLQPNEERNFLYNFNTNYFDSEGTPLGILGSVGVRYLEIQPYMIKDGEKFFCKNTEVKRLICSPDTAIDICIPGTCGDGLCDASIGEDGASCPIDCGCGNNILNTGEQCDDGNTNDLDSCRNNCQLPVCGDGVCNGADTCSNCVGDCGVCPPSCDVDGICEAGESCPTCPDCVTPCPSANPTCGCAGDGCSLIGTVDGIFSQTEKDLWFEIYSGEGACTDVPLALCKGTVPFVFAQPPYSYSLLQWQTLVDNCKMDANSDGDIDCSDTTIIGSNFDNGCGGAPSCNNNGLVDVGEECDGGQFCQGDCICPEGTGPSGFGYNGCTSDYCYDDIVNNPPWENCDEGNINDGCWFCQCPGGQVPSAAASCSTCGNGISEGSSETCDGSDPASLGCKGIVSGGQFWDCSCDFANGQSQYGPGFYCYSPIDPCFGNPLGTLVFGGLLCAGRNEGIFPVGRYLVTPSGCTDSVTPTCAGGPDVVQKAWASNSGTSGYNVVTRATSLFGGKVNTHYLAKDYTDTDAALYCQNMIFGGYTDWYLPSKNELNLVLYGMKTAGRGNLGTVSYWASTENSATTAWSQDFGSGVQGASIKTSSAYVRCIRRF